MLRGYSVPRSPEGRAALVPPPPWHYVGAFLVIEYWADPEEVAAVLPRGLEPYPDDPGRCAAIFADWQSCSAAYTELTDPVRSQYREFFLVVNALYRGDLVTTCPYIWVDKDFALARGWIQGFPKKLGEIHMTRTLTSQSPQQPPCSRERASAPLPPPMGGSSLTPRSFFASRRMRGRRTMLRRL